MTLYIRLMLTIIHHIAHIQYSSTGSSLYLEALSSALVSSPLGVCRCGQDWRTPSRSGWCFCLGLRLHDEVDESSGCWKVTLLFSTPLCLLLPRVDFFGGGVDEGSDSDSPWSLWFGRKKPLLRQLLVLSIPWWDRWIQSYEGSAAAACFVSKYCLVVITPAGSCSSLVLVLGMVMMQVPTLLNDTQTHTRLKTVSLFLQSQWILKYLTNWLCRNSYRNLNTQVQWLWVVWLD